MPHGTSVVTNTNLNYTLKASPSALIFREQVSPPVPGSGEQAPSSSGSGDQASHPDSDLPGRLFTVHRSCLRTDLIEHFKVYKYREM